MALLCAGALPAAAADVYASGNLGISGGVGDSGGSTPFFDNTGSDSDGSPSYGASVGLETSLGELLPLDWESWEIASLGMRFELEGLAGRDYELFTQGGDEYRTSVNSWTLMNNVWLDVPVGKPIASLFGRVPVLEPMSVYVGGGLGMVGSDVSTTDNVSRGSRVDYDLAWQVGAGLGYDLTRHVTFSAGYRYVDLGSADFSLTSAGIPFGNYSIDLSAHEIQTSLRIRFHSFALRGR